ncbi:MAG: hypothetical protein MN733_29935 [Nitrososphaera sp.]|nr:hypothetical protein [Nitrososphaera sp.]
MPLFNEDDTLESVLGRQAETQRMDIRNQFAKKRRQAVSEQARAGRLGSGVANFPLGDIDASEAGALADVEGGLAGALGSIPTEDVLGERDFQRNLSLAKLIASLNEESDLSQALGLIGTGGQLAATAAGLF